MTRAAAGTKQPFKILTYLTARGHESEYQRRLGWWKRNSWLLRIYDWTAKHGGDRSVTRFEAELNRGLPQLDGLEEIADPFRYVVVVALAPALRDASYVDGLILRDVCFAGSGDRLPRLSTRQRARVRRLMKLGKAVPRPSDVFRNCWVPTIRSVLRQLGVAPIPRGR